MTDQQLLAQKALVSIGLAISSAEAGDYDESLRRLTHALIYTKEAQGLDWTDGMTREQIETIEAIVCGPRDDEEGETCQ